MSDLVTSLLQSAGLSPSTPSSGSSSSSDSVSAALGRVNTKMPGLSFADDLLKDVDLDGGLSDSTNTATVKAPPGAKFGDIFTWTDGNKYEVTPPALGSYEPMAMPSILAKLSDGKTGGESTTSFSQPAELTQESAAPNPMDLLRDDTLSAFPFTDIAKESLKGFAYQPRDYSKESEVSNQGGEYDTGTKNIFVDTGNDKIPRDQQQLVMAHEMLNGLFSNSPAGQNSKEFNADWEYLKLHGDADTKQLLTDVDNHMKSLGYQNITGAGDVMTSSRFSYLGQDAITSDPKEIPQQLQKYFDGVINFNKTAEDFQKIQKNNEIISQAQPQTFIQKMYSSVTDLLTTTNDPDRDAVIMSISKATGAKPDVIDNNLDSYTKALGLRSVPTTMEVVNTLMTLPVVAGLVSNPISAGLALGAWVGMDTLEKAVLGGRDLATVVSDNFHLNDASRTALQLLEFMGKGAALHQVYTKAPDVYDFFTKNLITTYNIPKDVYISPETARDIIAGRNTEEIQKIYDAAGRTAEQAKQDIKNGISIKIPLEKVVTMTDKPWYAKLKEDLSIKPNNPFEVSRGFVDGKPERTPGILGEGSAPFLLDSGNPESVRSSIEQTKQSIGLSKTPPEVVPEKLASESTMESIRQAREAAGIKANLGEQIPYPKSNIGKETNVPEMKNEKPPEVKQVTAKEEPITTTAEVKAPKPVETTEKPVTAQNIAPSVKSINAKPQGGGKPSKTLEKPIPGETKESKLEKARKAMKETEKKFGVRSKKAKFKGFEDVTTKILNKLTDREEVSKQFISDLTNSPDIKQVERDLIREVLKDYPEGKSVPVKEFAEKVKAELLPLTMNSAKASDLPTNYEHVSLPESQRGPVANYDERIYESPVKTSAGQIHFGHYDGSMRGNYFGHTRVEDLAHDNLLDEDGEPIDIEDMTPAQRKIVENNNGAGTTRRIIEVQSDLYQKGGVDKEIDNTRLKNHPQIRKVEIEREIKALQESIDSPDVNKVAKEDYIKRRDGYLQDLKEIEPDIAEKQKLHQYNNHTAHFRMVREEIKQAAIDGKTKLQFPTGETAMKIEGLGQAESNNFVTYKDGISHTLRPDELTVGLEINQGDRSNGDWIITDVLGDGKFKAVPQSKLLDPQFNYGLKSYGPGHWNVKNGLKAMQESDHLQGFTETFDISGKVDTNNPIFRFYEKELGRYLASKYDAKKITDAQGVSWYEVNVQSEEAGHAVEAFKKAVIKESGQIEKLANDEGIPFNKTTDWARSMAQSFFGDDVDIVFQEGELIDGNAWGQFTPANAWRNPLVKLVTNKGLVQDVTMYHEFGHAFLSKFTDPADRAKLIAAIKLNPVFLPKNILTRLNGYTGNDVVAEEIIMDTFAEYAKGKDVPPETKSFFQRMMDVINGWIQKITGMQKFFDRIMSADRSQRQTSARFRDIQKVFNRVDAGVRNKVSKIKFEDDDIEKANKELTDSLEKEAKKEKSEVDKVIAAKEFSKEIAEQTELDRMEQSITEETLLSDPARQLSKYVNKRTGELPEVTGKATSIFAEKGDDIVSELGFKDSEEARAAYQLYAERRSRFLATKENISKLNKDYREKKQIIEAVTKELRKEGLSRKQRVDAIQEFFNLTNEEMREVTKKTPDYRLITEKEFENLLTGFEGMAYDAFLKSQARAQLEFTIFDKELIKTDNLRKAMKMPELRNMSRAQLEKFNLALEGFKTGDEFLGVRQIETIKNTDLSTIKTKREALEDLAKRTGVPFSEMQNIKVTEFDRYLYDVALARRNPFYKIMVEDTSKALATANVRLYEFKSELNKLVLKSRHSRSTGLVDKIIPTDDAIFSFLSADAATKLELAKRLTTEELATAKFIMDKYAEARDYLISKGQLDRYRMNYITHVQRGFLEALKDAMKPRMLGKEAIGVGEAVRKGIVWKILDPIKELFDQYKQQEAVFTIMNQKTGEVLPLEKFFKFAMTRSGELTPSRNVSRAVIAYMTAFEKKVALDSIVPKIDVYASSLTPRGMTKRGLEMDDSLKRFVKEWLNTKRGRVLNELVKPGGKVDWAIRSGVAFTRLLDLGANIPIGLASNIGEQVTTYVNIGAKRTSLGIARSLTDKGKKIAEKYEGLVGEKLIDKIRDTSKDLGDKFSQAIFGLFSAAARRANIEHLLGSMTPEEFASGELSPARIGEIRLEIGKYRTIEQGSSVIGATALGKAFTQYKSWAVPIMHSVTNNLKVLSKMMASGEDFSKSKEFHETLRATIALAFLGFSTYALYAHLRDKKDRNFLENLAYKSMNDAFSLFGALDPALWLSVPRLVAFLADLGTAVSNVSMSLVTGERTSDGSIKGLKKLETTITPAVARQFLPSDESKLKDQVEQAYEDIKHQAETDKPGALAALTKLKKDYPTIYDKVRQMLVDDKKGVTTSEKLIRAMGVANGERARYIRSQGIQLKTDAEKSAYIKNLTDKGIITKEVKAQLKELKETGDLKVAPEYKPNTVTSEYDILTTVSTYAEAIGADPLVAFNRIFTGQRIRRVDNGAIIVERMSLDESSAVASKQASELGVNRAEMRLDHKIPLELGGSNSESNLWLVPTAQWQSFSPIENYLGKALREKRITKADAQELITQFKDGLIDAGYIYNHLEK